MPKTDSNSAAEKDPAQTPRYAQYAPQYAQPFEDDTIDLYELWITLWSTSLYYRGYRALNAEIAILLNRKSDDPFIMGLRDLQESLALLRSIKIEDEGLRAVSIDQASYPPKTRIKPNRRLIVSLGTVVGLFLGIFLVFFVSLIQNQKEAHAA